MEKSIYSCIDLKSFYASVEAAERKLDPFKENLVVADPSRGRVCHMPRRHAGHEISWNQKPLPSF